MAAPRKTTFPHPLALALSLFMLAPHLAAQALVEGPCTPERIVTYSPPRSTLSAVFYYAWHTASQRCDVEPNSDWCQCIWRFKPQEPRPIAGLYGSNDPTVVGAHLDQLVDHGVNVVAIQWDRKLFELDNILNVLIPAIEARRLRGLQFVLLYDLDIRFEELGLNFSQAEVRQAFVDDFSEFATNAHYFPHAQYLKFDGKPVIYLYVARKVAADTAVADDIQLGFDQAIQAVSYPARAVFDR